MQALVAVDGPTALVVSDGDDHKRRRRLVQPAFSIKRVDAHLGLVVTEVDRALDDVAARHRSSTRPTRCCDAIRRIVVRALFGEELGAEADRFGELLEPGPRLRAEDAAAALRARPPHQPLRPGAAQQPGRPTRSCSPRWPAAAPPGDRRRDAQPDTLTALLAGVEGETLTDAELRRPGPQPHGRRLPHHLGRGVAGSSLELGRNPEALAARPGRGRRRARRPGPHHRRPAGPAARPRRRAGDAAHVAARPGGAPHVDRAQRAPRHGRSRPAGWCSTAPTSPAGCPSSGPTPSGSTRPAGRPARPSRRRTRSCPFGGGYRRCIGFALATLELQVIAVRLAQQVEWRNRRTKVQPTGIATLSPKGGVPIEVTARRS